MEAYFPYIVAIVCAIISGFASYTAAKKQCDTTIETLKESNRHDIEVLMKKHEVDIDNLKRVHELEIEKMELEHKHQIENDTTKMQNQVVANIVSGVFGVAFADPSLREALGSEIRKGFQK